MGSQKEKGRTEEKEDGDEEKDGEEDGTHQKEDHHQEEDDKKEDDEEQGTHQEKEDHKKETVKTVCRFAFLACGEGEYSFVFRLCDEKEKKSVDKFLYYVIYDRRFEAS